MSKHVKKVRIARLGNEFYNQECIELANALLGKVLCRRQENGEVVSGYIIETEAYPGGDDKASYSYNGRRTKTNEPMYMSPGTSFVYMTYGMYHMLNISSLGEGSAVLLRALEPNNGTDTMEKHRNRGKKEKKFKTHELCNGPAKLCTSLNINKTCNAVDMCTSDLLWIEEPGGDSPLLEFLKEENIVKGTRIGINSAGAEWASKLFRFYIKGVKSVSKRDTIQEGANIN